MTGTSQSVVDTNVIVRFLIRDDEPLYQRAAVIMAAIREGHRTALIPDIVIAECVYVLQRFYKVPRSEIAVHLRSVLSYPGVATENRIVVFDALDHYNNHNVSFVDAMCASVAAHRGFDLITFDKQLARLVGQKNPRK